MHLYMEMKNIQEEISSLRASYIGFSNNIKKPQPKMAVAYRGSNLILTGQNRLRTLFRLLFRTYQAGL